MRSLLFSLVLVLVVLVLAVAAFRVFRVPEDGLPGYWASPTGELFEIARGSPAGGLRVATASGCLGARAGESYPLALQGYRRVSASFPQKTLRGRVALDRRRLIWKGGGAPWYRQGV